LIVADRELSVQCAGGDAPL